MSALADQHNSNCPLFDVLSFDLRHDVIGIRAVHEIVLIADPKRRWIADVLSVWAKGVHKSICPELVEPGVRNEQSSAWLG